MPAQALADDVQTFFDTIATTIETQTASAALPLVGVTDSGLRDAVTAELEETRDALIAALEDPTLAAAINAAANDEARAQLIADALAVLDGALFAITATVAAGTDQITITLEDDAAGTSTGAAVDATLGVAGLGVDVSATADLTGTADYAFSFVYDVSDETLDKQAVADELTFTLEGDLDFDGAGSLGALGLTVTETGTEPDLSVVLGFDISDGEIGGPGGVVDAVNVSGGALLELNFVTDAIAGGVLPSIETGLVVGLELAEVDLLSGGTLDVTPSVSFNDVTVRIDALAELFDGFFGQLTGILDVFPLRQISNLLNREVPIISTLSPGETITFRDLIELFANAENEFGYLDALVDLIGILDAVENLSNLTDGINLGSIDLNGAALQSVVDGLAVDLDDLLGDLTLPDVDPLSLIPALDGIEGLSFPFLTGGPGEFARILLNELGGGVTELVTYDVPSLFFSAGISRNVNIFGPIVATFGGEFGGGIDISVGYSTNGLFDENPNFLGGFFVRASEPENAQGFAPVASLLALVEAGVGLDFFIGGASVTGGVLGTLGIGLEDPNGDGFTHLNEIQFPCLFGEIGGALDVFARLTFKIGIGPLSWERKINIFSATIVSFNFDIPCEGPHGQENTEIADGGLATETDLPNDIWTLNVGGRSNLRTLPDGIDEETAEDGTLLSPRINETFILKAPETPDGQPQRPGVAIEAFGITEVIAEDAPPTLIRAEAGDGNDALIVEGNLGFAVSFDGGAGDDILTGGELDDSLLGGDGDDNLSGGDGNDTILGGIGNDVIETGAGADSIDGGAGFDEVSYANSQEGVSFQVQVVPGGVAFVGTGGDAEGDILRNIEGLVGSREDDTFIGNLSASNIIDGGAGDDSLLGGSEDDLLIGGEGGDEIDGGGGSDQTSYFLSEGGVVVNLSTGQASGGDAQGDQLTSIESIEGSIHADVLTSSGSDGILAGNNGDDTLRSLGGAVSLLGGLGDDLVLADDDGQGGVLDGGGFLNLRAGRDLLSYRESSGPIVVDLGALSAGADTITQAELANTAPGLQGTDFGIATGWSTFEDLEGSGEDDDLSGDNGDNSIFGGDGNDTLRGGAGDDVLIGGEGEDSLNGGLGIDLADYSGSLFAVDINLFSGTGSGGDADGDTLTNIENLRGTNRNDDLQGDNEDNRIDPGIALAGTDTVMGGGGLDVLDLNYASLSSGIDLEYIVSFGDVTGGTNLTFSSIDAIELDATNFVDTVAHEAFSDDILILRDGNDNVTDGGGRDIILMGDGDDTISHAGLSGSDFGLLLIDGGRGIDRLSIDLGNATGDINLSMGLPTVENLNQAFSTQDLVAITGIEILVDVDTGAGNDTLIQPGFVNNVFRTGLGDDFIAPGLGFDMVDGGDPAPTTETDIDILFLDYTTSAAEQVTSTFLTQSGRGVWTGLNPTIDRLEYSNIERIFAIGTAGDDEMRGSSDIIDIGDGNILFGAAGNDTLIGGFQDDFLAGGAGGDVLEGLDGDDTLVGGVAGGDDAIDTLTGGAGADIFVLGDATGYHYGEFSASTIDNRDGVVINDFDPTEGDILQLTGAPGDYFAQEFLGSTIMVRGAPGIQAIDLILFGFTGFDLTESYVTYVPEPALSIAQPDGDFDALVAEFNALAGTDLTTADLTANLLPSAQEATASFDAGDITAQSLLDVLATTAEAAPETESEAALRAGAEGVLSIDTATDPTSVLRDILFDVAFSIPGSLATAPTVDIERIGDTRGHGVFHDGFGFETGVVLSTGRVIDLAGSNLLDGARTDVEVARGSTTLTFEDLGRVGDATIFRADVTGLDITSITLTDAYLLDGAGGFATGADIDRIFFSTDDLSGGLSEFDTLEELDVFDFSPLGVALDPGPQRSDDPARPVGPNLAGTLNGFLNNADATLRVRDFGVDEDPRTTADEEDGFFSLGDGGSATFTLSDPLAGDPETPTYLYVAEAGALERFYLTARNVPVGSGLESDLSTDFGTPGVQDDLIAFDIEMSIPIEGQTGQLVERDLFQIVGAFESVLELAGSDFQDRFRVTVNGVEALVLRDGSAATLNNLALSPFGQFHPDFRSNPAGTGPLANQLRADGYTAVLTVRAPLVLGLTNHIRIEVEDRGDGFLDTALFLAAADQAETFDDVVALFETDTSPAPLDIYSTLEAAAFFAPNQAVIRVGEEASEALGDVGVVDLTREGLTIQASGSIEADLHLDDGIEDASLLGTATLNLTGNDEDNELRGNSGDNILAGLGGADRLVGGAGADTADYSASPDQVFVSVNGALAFSGDAQDDSLSGIENLLGSTFADLLRGDGLANVLMGGDGGDYLQGQDGNDSLLGEDGNDVLEGGPGADFLDGGDGDGDFFSALDATSTVTIDIADLSLSSPDYADDTILNIEGYIGAGDFSNRLFGAEADEQLIGGDVDDQIAGNGGDDILIGFAGNDTLEGGTGADLLFGDEGDDLLTGGGARDLFLFIDDGVDTITDFALPAGGGFVDRLLFDIDGATYSDLVFSSTGGGDAVITYGSASQIIFEGVDVGDLNPTPGEAPDWIIVV